MLNTSSCILDLTTTMPSYGTEPLIDTRFGSRNSCYVNPFVQGLRSPRRLPYTSLLELLHPLTRGSAGGQTEAGDIIGSHIQQFHGYTATKPQSTEKMSVAAC